MFFKKRKSGFSKYGPLREIAWDEEAVKNIAESQSLSVKITGMTRTVAQGKSGVDRDERHTSEWSGHGVMTLPKFIPVTISFNGGHEEFGGFSYNRLDNQDLNDTSDFSLPSLNVWLSDPDGRKAQLIYEALRDAILSGNTYTGVKAIADAISDPAIERVTLVKAEGIGRLGSFRGRHLGQVPPTRPGLLDAALEIDLTGLTLGHDRRP
jgi:hypothetical protein